MHLPSFLAPYTSNLNTYPVRECPRNGLNLHILFDVSLLFSYLLSRWAAHIYSSVATLVPFVLAAGDARGNALQEATIKVVLYSAAPPFFVSMAVVLWGLRTEGENEDH